MSNSASLASSSSPPVIPASLASSSNPPVIPASLVSSSCNLASSSAMAFSSANLASSSSPPVISASLAPSSPSLASSSNTPVISASLASSSAMASSLASLASSSSQHVIPANLTCSSPSLASSTNPPVIPASLVSSSAGLASSSPNLASSSSPPVIPASLASSSNPPVIPASLAFSSSPPVIPASLACSSPSLASSSSQPVIPASLASSSPSLASSSSPPVIPASLASSSAGLASSSSTPVIPMDPQLREFFKACRKGYFSDCINLIVADPNILLTTNPHMNNCLHIAAMLGHHDFATSVWTSAPSRVPYLFSGTNVDGETPLIAALMAPNLLMASSIITAASQYMHHDDLDERMSLSRMLLKVDRCNENVLHHALRNGFEKLALRLLEIEPRLSKQATNTGESPMYMAVRRGYSNIVERLLQIPFSIDSGPADESALYVAVLCGNTGIVKKLMERRPHLVWQNDKAGINPVVRAVLDNNLDLVKIFLEINDNFAYMKNEKTGNTPFLIAVQKGYLSIAKEIINTYPDSVYIANKFGRNALHHAIYYEKPDIVEYILRTPQLHRLINQADNNGELPLHEAARMCDPKFLRSLITHTGQDYTARNFKGSHAVNLVYGQKSLWNTLKWNESITLLLNIIPSGWKYVIRDEVKKANKKQAIKEVKSLTEKYTSNTSLVAALIATITFAAAFTLPGGFSSDPANDGLPIFARKAIFQVFLISDTIAMCSSLAVTFLCILTTWDDLDFLLNYRKTTKALMWSAYGATALAFGSGLFTVIAPNNLWLAILILVLSTILPLLSKIIGEWPLLMVRYRLRGIFMKDLVPNI